MGLLCEVDVADWGLPDDLDYSKPLQDFVDAVINDAQANCPVRTGYLRSTIGDGAIVSQTYCSIPVSCEYAQYVEYGTYKMEAQPYFEPAIEMYLDDLANACCDIVAESQEEEAEAELIEPVADFEENDGMAEEADQELQDLYEQLADVEAQAADCEDEDEIEQLEAERNEILERIDEVEENRNHHIEQTEQSSLIADLICAVVIALIEAIFSIFEEIFSGDYDSWGEGELELLDDELISFVASYDLEII